MFKYRIYKWCVLFLIILVPGILILFFSSAKHEFNTLPIVSNSSISFNENEFLNQDSIIFNQDSLSGKINIICFFFSRCPTICPKMITNMNWLKDHFLGFNDINFLSFSIDPEHDNPVILKEYIIKNKINAKNWHFLTGEKEHIYNLAERMFVSVQKDLKAPGGYLHSGSFILLDKSGKIRSRTDDDNNILGVYDGTRYVDIKNLHKDIQVLKAEYNKNEE